MKNQKTIKDEKGGSGMPNAEIIKEEETDPEIKTLNYAEEVIFKNSQKEPLSKDDLGVNNPCKFPGKDPFF